MKLQRLPSEFVINRRRSLKYRRHRRDLFEHLPFVNLRARRGPRVDALAASWDVPATGGYFGGYATGEAMAYLYLKMLRQHPRDTFLYMTLTEVVGSFMHQFEANGGRRAARELADGGGDDRYSSFRGQYTGFFNTLGMWLLHGAATLGNKLDGLTEREIMDCANEGLAFDHDAYMKSLDLAER